MKALLIGLTIFASMGSLAYDGQQLSDSIEQIGDNIVNTYENIGKTYEKIGEAYETTNKTLSLVLILKHERNQLMAIGLILEFESGYCDVFDDIEQTISSVDPLVESVMELSNDISSYERADHLETLEDDYKDILLNVCKQPNSKQLIESNIEKYKSAFDRVTDTLYVTRRGGKSLAE